MVTPLVLPILFAFVGVFSVCHSQGDGQMRVNKLHSQLYGENFPIPLRPTGDTNSVSLLRWPLFPLDETLSPPTPSPLIVPLRVVSPLFGHRGSPSSSAAAPSSLNERKVLAQVDSGSSETLLIASSCTVVPNSHFSPKRRLEDREQQQQRPGASRRCSEYSSLRPHSMIPLISTFGPAIERSVVLEFADGSKVRGLMLQASPMAATQISVLVELSSQRVRGNNSGTLQTVHFLVRRFVLVIEMNERAAASMLINGASALLGVAPSTFLSNLIPINASYAQLIASNPRFYQLPRVVAKYIAEKCAKGALFLPPNFRVDASEPVTIHWVASVAKNLPLFTATIAGISHVETHHRQNGNGLPLFAIADSGTNTILFPPDIYRRILDRYCSALYASLGELLQTNPLLRTAPSSSLDPMREYCRQTGLFVIPRVFCEAEIRQQGGTGTLSEFFRCLTKFVPPLRFLFPIRKDSWSGVGKMDAAPRALWGTIPSSQLLLHPSASKRPSKYVLRRSIPHEGQDVLKRRHSERRHIRILQETGLQDETIFLFDSLCDQAVQPLSSSVGSADHSFALSHICALLAISPATELDDIRNSTDSEEEEVDSSAHRPTPHPSPFVQLLNTRGVILGEPFFRSLGVFMDGATRSIGFSPHGANGVRLVSIDETTWNDQINGQNSDEDTGESFSVLGRSNSFLLWDHNPVVAVLQLAMIVVAAVFCVRLFLHYRSGRGAMRGCSTPPLVPAASGM